MAVHIRLIRSIKLLNFRHEPNPPYCHRCPLPGLPGSTAAQAQTTFDTYAITGVTLIDAGHIPGVVHQTVIIQKSKIEKIFPDGSHTLPDSISIIRATGKYLIPGLIDTHVHMATDPSGTDNRPSTLRVLESMLRSGITTVRDMAGDARVLAGLARDARTGDILSPDIYYSALMAGPEFFADPGHIALPQEVLRAKCPICERLPDHRFHACRR